MQISDMLSSAALKKIAPKFKPETKKIRSDTRIISTIKTLFNFERFPFFDPKDKYFMQNLRKWVTANCSHMLKILAPDRVMACFAKRYKKDVLRQYKRDFINSLFISGTIPGNFYSETEIINYKVYVRSIICRYDFPKVFYCPICRRMFTPTSTVKIERYFDYWALALTAHYRHEHIVYYDKELKRRKFNCQQWESNQEVWRGHNRFRYYSKWKRLISNKAVRKVCRKIRWGNIINKM